MKAKLIKTKDGFYVLNDEFGNYIHGKLSIKKCQAIERGYDLDELAEEVYPIENTGNMYMPNRHEVSSIFRQEGFKAGFQKALELMGDKKFSEEDIYEAFSLGERGDRFELGELLDSHQQTEWDVEIEMEKYGRCELCLKAGFWHCAHADTCGSAVEAERPKLDADGCLILTFKSE